SRGFTPPPPLPLVKTAVYAEEQPPVFQWAAWSGWQSSAPRGFTPPPTLPTIQTTLPSVDPNSQQPLPEVPSLHVAIFLRPIPLQQIPAAAAVVIPTVPPPLTEWTGLNTPVVLRAANLPAPQAGIVRIPTVPPALSEWTGLNTAVVIAPVRSQSGLYPIPV